MARNTSVTLGEHFDVFIEGKIKEGRYSSTSEAVRAGLRLLEEREMRVDRLRTVLAKGEAELDQGKSIDGDSFMNELIDG